MWMGRNLPVPLTTLADPVERLFETFFATPAAAEVGYPNMNVWETEAGYHVEAELPGFRREEIELSLHDGEISLRAEHSSETEHEDADGATWHCRERARRTFRRTLRLPPDVDAGKAEARLENGVLKVFLPKAEAKKPRRIPVKGK